MDKKKVMWTLVSIGLAVLSVIAVFSQAGSLSVGDLQKAFREADAGWLIASALSSLGFIVFEGEALLSILRNLGYKRKHREGFLYAAGDVYFSAMTPSASGGQPASAYFMMKNNIPGSVVTATLLLNLVMYTAGILTVGAFCIIAAPDAFLHFHLISRILIIAGYLVLTLLAVVFVLLLVRQSMLEKICIRLYRTLHKLHLMRHPEKRIARLERYMEEYADCVAQMGGNKKIFLQCYLWNLAQRVSQITVSVFMYLATGGAAKNAFALWVTQALVSIGSNCVPIPGGMGVADYLMIDGFRTRMSHVAATQLELLSRSMAFYVSVLVSGLTVLIGYFVYKKRPKKEQ
ncbi:MAG: flippase-like domain-containing protein [Lachnospiraceae bacterium]|nr:flippase-like domain-containing protein [Lachnospiraceae bacterium]